MLWLVAIELIKAMPCVVHSHDDRPFRLLVVDDEDNIRDMLRRWFESRGFLVDSAHDGETAVECCTQKPYDLVLMDVKMPGMDGVDASAAIHGICPDLPIVLLTGYPARENLSPMSGVVRVLHKPQSLRGIEQTLRSVLESQ